MTRSDKNTKTITICASVAFYKQVLDIEKELKKLGFKVIVPITAKRMEKENNFDAEKWKTWYIDPTQFHIKKKLMEDHFKKVIKADAILIVNLTKSKINGYIGGNVLMEMTVAHLYKKPIYIYDIIVKELPIYEEVMGLNPTFINKDLSKIK